MILVSYLSKLSQTVLYHVIGHFQATYMAGNSVIPQYVLC